MTPGSLIVFGNDSWLYVGSRFSGLTCEFMHMYLKSSGELYECYSDYTDAELFKVNVITP